MVIPVLTYPLSVPGVSAIYPVDKTAVTDDVAVNKCVRCEVYIRETHQGTNAYDGWRSEMEFICASMHCVAGSSCGKQSVSVTIPKIVD